MLEKTLNARKKIILLRSFFAVLMVCSLVLCCASPVIARAAWSNSLEYTDLDYTVRYGNGVNTVTFPLPSDGFKFQATNNGTGDKWVAIDKDYLIFPAQQGDYFDLYVYPVSSAGLAVDNLPDGARLHIEVSLENITEDMGYSLVGDVLARWYYLDSNAKWLKNGSYELDVPVIGQTHSLDYVYEYVPGAVAFVPSMRFKDVACNYGNGSFRLAVVSAFIEMDVTTEYWSQFQNQLNGEMLGDIKEGIGDLNDKIDTLPEDIGNSMQGVLDSENEKAESSGNKFVNQILDKLPDPSTEVLTALKKLTDATAYTGTDAKLSIPAIVIPEIAGLIPETELWGGTEFSFSDYLDFLPSTLVTVVQSLFTIAIVLYCVYELKGIISYCLTLNDKKGG